MSSVFTYDPDPPRVSSPWLTPVDSPNPSTPASRSQSIFLSGLSVPSPSEYLTKPVTKTPPPGLLSDYNVTKLEPEPQTGPAEYKLHILLRPRRSYSSTSTCSPSTKSLPSGIPSPSSRQNRLQQLTTQLLWRLQQSSPYHASSKSDLVLPQLPEAAERLESPTRPAKLLAGLEGSRGALYEIGVSDDGTLVGLTEDEMEESLTNLRAMAASLGCNVEITRMVAVGECEWYPSDPVGSTQNDDSENDQQREVKKHSKQKSVSSPQHGTLWVAEALVIPDLGSTNEEIQPAINDNRRQNSSEYELTSRQKEQLRVTLTGPTTSGKSSLLGTLTTATLDNGRGKSRLSLLKHRHELASGVTSSVTHELLGYRPAPGTPGVAGEVVNYATGNVSSWTDIHAATENGRLVFVSDSAGHPRYRRTTVRGLIGWAPHWTLLCIAADDAESTGAGRTASAQDILGSAGVGVDFSNAHLDLCLKLERPLAVIINKLDLASKTSLRQTLAKILSAVKAAGRIPAVLPPDQIKNIEFDLGIVPENETVAVGKVLDNMHLDDLNRVVPIIMTSSAKGSGIRGLHALLYKLPIPPPPKASDYVGDALNPEQPTCLFHIEDTFDIPASYAVSSTETSESSGTVVAGYLRFGSLSVGDCIVVGPFPQDIEGGNVHDNEVEQFRSRASADSALTFPQPRSAETRAYTNFSRSLSHPSTSELTQLGSRRRPSTFDPATEWRKARVVSIRNLRLPVHILYAGQVGTIGIVFLSRNNEGFSSAYQIPRIRKGMILAIQSRHMKETGLSLQAASRFTASFEDEDVNSVSEGSIVVLYVASIRASARVVRVSPHELLGRPGAENTESDEVFGLDDEILDSSEESDQPVFGSDGVTDVTLELLTSREWIELGSQVLIMSGGGQGLFYGSERGEKSIAGLEGFVGKVIEIVE